MVELYRHSPYAFHGVLLNYIIRHRIILPLAHCKTRVCNQSTYTCCGRRDVLLLNVKLYETEICSGSLGLRHKRTVMLFHKQFEQVPWFTGGNLKTWRRFQLEVNIFLEKLCPPPTPEYGLDSSGSRWSPMVSTRKSTLGLHKIS